MRGSGKSQSEVTHASTSMTRQAGAGLSSTHTWMIVTFGTRAALDAYAYPPFPGAPGGACESPLTAAPLYAKPDCVDETDPTVPLTSSVADSSPPTTSHS